MSIASRNDETQEIPCIETMQNIVSSKLRKDTAQHVSPWACPGYIEESPGRHLAPSVDSDENATSNELFAINLEGQNNGY